MKRNLNHTQYQMSAGKRENLWHAIRRETHGTAAGKSRRTKFRPALAVTAVVATISLMVAWHMNSQLTGRGLGGGPFQIAGLGKNVAPAPSTDSEALARQDMALTIPQESLPVTVLKSRDVPVVDAVSAREEVAEAPVTEAGPPKNETESTTEVQIVDRKPDARYGNETAADESAVSSGVVMAAGELKVRGGRSGEIILRNDGERTKSPTTAQRTAPPTEPVDHWGSVTGGTTPPNGEQVELMYFESAGVNPFVATEDDALSTFALDVDNASWTMARNYLARGIMPPRDAVRVEEFVNAFDAGWAHHTDRPFRIHTDGAGSRFGKGYHLLRIGLVGREVDASERKPANLVFVIDVSGSMARESRLGTVKQALHILLDELREGDRVGIVVYGSHGEVRLPLTDISSREQITAAIDGLQTGGSTNAAQGLELGYRMARDSYDAGIINRLILCSDGVANTGRSTEAGHVLDFVRTASDEGITLSTIGFGMGNYNDVFMEKLANQGDGNYFYVDKMAEAERVFRQNLTGLLQTIAREVKVQVEFNEEFVQRWRLLGYENREVADEDFRNDQVDAGEVGAGHQVTALYELKLTRPADREAAAGSGEVLRNSPLPDPAPAFRVGTIRLRHEAPAHDTVHAGQVTEIEQTILMSQFEGTYATAAAGMRVQAVVAEFAEILRGSYWAKGHTLVDLVPVADALALELAGDEQVQDLARMIRQAADLAAE